MGSGNGRATRRSVQRLAENRDFPCRKSVEEIATYLRGNWREEHVFNLKMALVLYDQIAQLLADYEAELAHQMQALQPPDRRDASVPPHPNRTKEGSTRACMPTKPALRRNVFTTSTPSPNNSAISLSR